MQDPKKIRRNLETDFIFYESFGKRNADGNFVPIAIPDDDVDFVLEIWAEGGNGKKYKASRVDGVYKNCEKIGSSRLKVYVQLSKYCLGKGLLCRKLYIRYPDGFYQNAPMQICVPDYTGIELYNGPSDDCEIIPEDEETFAGAFHGKDGVSTFYQIHTKKNNYSQTDGVKVGNYDFYTVIEGASADNLAEMADPAKYRLVLLQERKHIHEGRCWRIPMLPYVQAERTGRGVSSTIVETDTWWPVTGRIVPWFRDGRKLNQVLPLTISERKKRFAATRNIKHRIGVALFKYTGAGGEGWTRISNIAHVELLVCNRANSNPAIGVTVIS